MEKRDVISSCDRCCFHAFGEVSLFPSCWTMPRTKFHSRHRPKRRAPVRGQKTTPVPSTANGPSATASGVRDSPRTASTTGTTASSSATASERKLSKSPHTIHESSEIESESENEREYEGKGVRMLEVAGLQSALGGVCCSECKSGPIVFREEMSGGLHISVSLL